MSDRCTGACCRLFTLPRSPEELQEGALDARQRSERGVAGDADVDLMQIASMVTLVATVDAAAAEWWLGHPSARARDRQTYFYTCKNLLPNGDCGIYALRPRMCREFPYGQPCTYYGACASTAARAGAVGTPHESATLWRPDVRGIIAGIEDGAAWR